MQSKSYIQKKIRLLENQHAVFKNNIKREYNKVNFDTLKVLTLKKMKLKIKDQLENLRIKVI